MPSVSRSAATPGRYVLLLKERRRRERNRGDACTSCMHRARKSIVNFGKPCAL